MRVLAYPHIQVASFEVKAFSKLRISPSSCLLGAMHTPEMMALPFPKLFPSRAKSSPFGWEPVFPSHQVCSLWCSTSLTQLNGFSGGTTLGTTLPPSTLHSEALPGLLVTSTSGPRGFQGFLPAPGSAEYFVITSYGTQPSLLLFHLFLTDRTFPCPVRITLVTALTLGLLFWEVQLLALDFS